MADRRVIQCNYRYNTKTAMQGARAYLVRANPGGGDDRIVVLARSRSGRWVEKWEPIRRLRTFRVKVLPDDHPLHGDERIRDGEDIDALLVRLRAPREDDVVGSTP